MKPNTRTIQTFEMTLKEEDAILFGNVDIGKHGIDHFVYDFRREKIEKVKLTGEDFLREVCYVDEEGK